MIQYVDAEHHVLNKVFGEAYGCGTRLVDGLMSKPIATLDPVLPILDGWLRLLLDVTGGLQLGQWLDQHAMTSSSLYYGCIQCMTTGRPGAILCP